MGRSVIRAGAAAAIGVLVLAGLVAPDRSAAQPATPLATPSAATEAGASRLAQAAGQPVEVTGMTSETRKVMANPDGTFTADIAAGPVRIKDQAGGWREVDLTLEKRADGTVAPRAHPRGLVLSGAAGDGVHDLALLGSGPARVTLGWRGALPSPRLSGSTATYPNVRPGIDLVIEAQRTGFEESLVVNDRSAVAGLASIAMPWRVGGIAPKPAADGGFELRDAKGVPVGRVPPGQMWDARVSPQSGEHTRQAPVRLATKAVADGFGTDVTLVPDPAMMSDPTLVFPVTLDPAVTFYPSGYDAFVQNSYSTDQSGASELRLGYSDEGGSFVARSLIRFNTAGLVGKHITAAVLYLWETWAWSCRAFRWEVWVTGWADTSTRWGNQPTWIGQSDPASTMTKGYDPCGSADGWVTSNAAGAFQYAADHSYTYLPMGIRADPADEHNHDSWKKFASSETGSAPHVAVTYNSRPNTPDTLRADGKTCATGTARPPVETTTGQPNLQARLSDPDGTERSLTGYFYVAELGTALPAAPNAIASPVASGNSATVPVPSSVPLTDGHVYHWASRTYDGVDLSGQSGECEFVVDNSGPAAPPVVSSTDYPADGNYHGGLGVTGNFTFAANGIADVARYRYWWDGKPSSEVAAPSLGAPVTVPITPPYPDVARTLSDVTVAGPRVLHVASVDPVGHVGPDQTWSILVGSAPPAAGWWKLDDAGTTFADSAGTHPATASGAVSKRPVGWGDGGSAYDYGNGGTAATASAAIDSGRSFTVSAWVNLASKGDMRSAVTQDGSRTSAFLLQYRNDTDRFAFVRTNSDTDNAPLAVALSTQAPQLGAWTLLTGVYDAGAQKISLYVNGRLAGTAPYTSAWNGGVLRIGMSRWNGGQVNSWSGAIDDVRAWQRVLDPREIASLASAQVGRWQLDWSGADSSGFGHDLSGYYAATYDTIGDDPADAGSAKLDGVYGTAYQTNGPVLRTDQSFSVSVWGMLSAFPLGNVNLVSQDGVNISPFFFGIRQDSGPAHWCFAMVDADSNNTVFRLAYGAATLTSADVGKWVHMVAVYDRPAQELRMYADGVLIATAARTQTPWQANGPLSVGRAWWSDPTTVPQGVDWWPGDIDDVRVYAGVLTPETIAMIDDGQL
jgi:hypothetical protein